MRKTKDAFLEGFFILHRKYRQIEKNGGFMSVTFIKRMSFALIISILTLSIFSFSSSAENRRSMKIGFIKKILEQREKNKENPNFSEKGFYVEGTGRSHNETLGDRSYIVYTPKSLPPRGQIPLLVVLHGGFGNAEQIKKYIGLDTFADQGGFIVAYLDGTQVGKSLPTKMKGWNAGGCCGQSAALQVDDIGFIASVINNMSNKYGIDPSQVYGTGHSNGAMMTQRVLCETNLYKNGVTISGTLQLDYETCPSAQGNFVINIHGAQDENLPVNGGHTTAGINTRTNYKSQENTRAVFDRSGATYELILLEGANHSPETLNGVLWKTEGMSLPQKIVTSLGLL